MWSLWTTDDICKMMTMPHLALYANCKLDPLYLKLLINIIKANINCQETCKLLNTGAIWYFEPLKNWPLFQNTIWYSDPQVQYTILIPSHGISNPKPMAFWTSCPWYFDPLTHGMSNPFLSWIVSQVPLLWNIAPSYGILNPLPMVFEHPHYLLIRNEWFQNTTGVQFTIKEGLFFNKGVKYTTGENWPLCQYTMGENWPQGQYTMGFKIPYDNGIVICHTLKFLYQFRDSEMSYIKVHVPMPG